MSNIDIRLIGITDLDTDCIVNAANSGLAMGSGERCRQLATRSAAAQQAEL